MFKKTLEEIANWLHNPNLSGNRPKATPVIEPEVKKAPKKKELSPKEKATAAGEPYVAILSVDLDPNDINNGAFELDWNDKFVVNLVKQGYKIRADDTDAQIVDRWFQDVCRNVVLETYEQIEANNPRGMNRRDIGNGRTEIG